MISVNDFKTGLTVELDNGLWSVVEFLHVTECKKTMQIAEYRITNFIKFYFTL